MFIVFTVGQRLQGMSTTVTLVTYIAARPQLSWLPIERQLGSGLGLRVELGFRQAVVLNYVHSALLNPEDVERITLSLTLTLTPTPV